jgi:hypothetical protein
MALPDRTLITLCLIHGLGFQACYHSAHHESDIQIDQDAIEDPGLEPEPDPVEPEAETSDPDMDVLEEIEVPPEPENAWIREYRGEAMSAPTQVRATLDGGYVFAAFGNSGEAGPANTIVKLDGEGFLQWARILSYGRSQVQGIVQTQDLGFGFLLNLDLFEVRESGFGLVKLDENGIRLWTRCMQSDSTSTFTIFEKTREGGFILGGSPVFAGGWDSLIVLLDEAGSILWEKRLLSSRDCAIKAIVQAEDGGFAAAGYVMDTDHGDTWVVKLSPAGDIEWQERISGSYEQAAYALVPTPDNGFVIGGRSGYELDGEEAYGPYIARLDEDGQVLWHKIIKGAGYGEILSLCPAHGGGFVGSGSIMAGSTGYDGILLKILDDGEKEWIKGYCWADNDSLYHVAQTQDEGYVALGPTYVYSPMQGSTWIVKANSRGGGMTGCPEGFGIDMMLTLEDTTFTVEPTSATSGYGGIEVLDIDLFVYDAEVEVETLCEGE